MSENQNRGAGDFAKFDSMSTQELEEILRLDAEAPEGQESDGELLLYVMGVLAKRKRDSGNPGKTAHEAWESFNEHYLPVEEEEYPAKKAANGTRPWLRRMIAAAAVIVLLIAVPLTASAFGWETFWNAVATWAKETFSFVTGEQSGNSEPVKTDALQFTSLQQALTETGHEGNFVPTWIPDGYDLIDITIGEAPEQKIYNAFYSKGETPLSIFVQAYLASDPQRIEIGEEPIEVYVASGVEYYIFENVDQTQIIWYTDSYECCISCELTMEEIKTMIDSIGKG